MPSVVLAQGLQTPIKAYPSLLEKCIETNLDIFFYAASKCKHIDREAFACQQKLLLPAFHTILQVSAGPGALLLQALVAMGQSATRLVKRAKQASPNFDVEINGLFQKYDADGSGHLSVADVHRLVDEIGGRLRDLIAHSDSSWQVQEMMVETVTAVIKREKQDYLTQLQGTADGKVNADNLKDYVYCLMAGGGASMS